MCDVNTTVAVSILQNVAIVASQDWNVILKNESYQEQLALVVLLVVLNEISVLNTEMQASTTNAGTGLIISLEDWNVIY